MTTPPSRLSEVLTPDTVFDLRGLDGQREGQLTYTQALAEAERGTIEGVGPRSGRIRYLRQLPATAAMPPLEKDTDDDDIYDSRSTAVAYTNIGTYKEPIYVKPAGLSLTDLTQKFTIVGYCYAFCLLRDRI